MKKFFLISGIVIVTIIISYFTIFFHKERPVNYTFITFDISPEEYPADFKEINQLVKQHYSLLSHKNIRIDSLYDTYASQVKKAKSSPEYGKLIIRYLAALQNGHSSPNFKRHTSGLEAITIEGRTFIDRIPPDFQEYKDIREKDEILAINDIPTSEWLRNQAPFISASTPQGLAVCADEMVFSSYTDTSRRFTIRTKDGIQEFKIPLKNGKKSYRLPGVYSHIFEDSIGYIAINTMMNGVVEEFEQVYPKIEDLPYLIVDVRKNRGGNSANSQKIAEYLLLKPQKACVSGRVITPSALAYKGKLFLLTGARTFSAAESFTLDIRESGRAILIGEPTGGDTGNRPLNFTTEQGISFTVPTRAPQLSPKGFPMEGTGIPPHQQVKQTVKDYQNDIDTALLATLVRIKTRRLL